MPIQPGVLEKSIMHYNLEIRNEDALPVPYAVTVGGKVTNVGSLYKDKTILCDVIYVTGTPSGVLSVHCKNQDIVIAITPQVKIRFLPEVERTKE